MQDPMVTRIAKKFKISEADARALVVAGLDTPRKIRNSDELPDAVSWAAQDKIRARQRKE